jgi:hypothetical protein
MLSVDDNDAARCSTEEPQSIVGCLEVFKARGSAHHIMDHGNLRTSLATTVIHTGSGRSAVLVHHPDVICISELVSKIKN